MSTSPEELIVGATQRLKLRDIALHEARFLRPTADVGDEPIEAQQENKRVVKFSKGSGTTSEGKEVALLQIIVELGTRVVVLHKDSENVPLIVIEADYIVEYEMLDDLPDEAVKAFAEFNAVHNVWPFWRQHVFDIVQRGRLPPLEIPLFAGMKL
jgi:hypothetical protein